MARLEIDPFEIGRRGLAIPFREFPIWLGCALWPFAATALDVAARRGLIVMPAEATAPIDWIAGTIFEWCWMIALCRSTTRQIVTFPAWRGFWLFVLLNLVLAALWWLFTVLLGIFSVAAYAGFAPFIGVSGTGVQVMGVVLAIST